MQIRVGVNSGEVVVRSIGSDLRMDYTAVGQTVHLAARMEQLARPGATLLSRHTLRLAEDLVEVKPLGPVPVKGLPDPVEVYELHGALHVRSRVHAGAGRGLTRFVGRDAELDALHQALEKTRAGHGQVVAVVGEPGVGKSRLFWEFLRSHRTDGWLVLEASSVSHGRATPYFPVIDLLRGYFKIQDGDDRRTLHEKVTGKLLTLDEALRPTLPALLALLDPRAVDPRWEALDPPHRRARTIEAVKRLLLRESLVQPLCLVVEDLHWIDSESQALLDDLIDGLPTGRLLLLVNCRPEYRHTWYAKSHYIQLRIDPLPEESARALLDTLLGEDPSLESLKALLIERTEGNPFFLEESVRTLVESRALLGERGAHRLGRATPTIEIPATVRAVLAARIDRLAPEDKRVLQQAAAVGKDVSFPLLRLVAEEPEDALRHRLGTLQAAEFLREARLFPYLEYTFTHALTHEVAYGGLVHDRRKSLHAGIANAMDQLYADRVTERAEALAYHAVRGEVWDRAVDALCLAGGAAYARGAISDTVDRCEQALDILPRLPARPETLRRAVDVRLAFFRPLFVMGQITRLTGLMEEAERLARELDDQARLATVLSLLAACANSDAHYPAASTYGREAFDIAVATADPTLRLQAASVLAMTHRARGEWLEAIDQLTPQVDGSDAKLARELPAVFGSLYVVACCQLVVCSSFLGRFTDASRYADLAIAEADAAETPLAQAAAYFFRATPALMRGEFDEALARLERTHRLCEAKGLLFFLSLSSIGMGYALARSGRSEEAVAAYDRGMSLQQALGMKSHASFVLELWGEGLLHVGRLAEARRMADQALELARTRGEAGCEAAVLVLLGDIAMVQDPPDVGGATGAYEEALTLGNRLGMRPLIAHCHLGLGKLYRRSARSTRVATRKRCRKTMTSNTSRGARSRPPKTTGTRCPDPPEDRFGDVVQKPDDGIIRVGIDPGQQGPGDDHPHVDSQGQVDNCGQSFDQVSEGKHSLGLRGLSIWYIYKPGAAPLSSPQPEGPAPGQTIAQAGLFPYIKETMPRSLSVAPFSQYATSRFRSRTKLDSDHAPAHAGADMNPVRFSTFAALRHRNFRLFYTGQMISLTGSWMQSVAFSWLVLVLTNSSFYLGLVGALQTLPVLLFSFLGGVVADHTSKLRLCSSPRPP